MGFVIHTIPHSVFDGLPRVLGDDYVVTRMADDDCGEFALRRFEVHRGWGRLVLTEYPWEAGDDESRANVFIHYKRFNPLMWIADGRLSRDLIRDLQAHGLEELIPVEDREADFE
ncbi:MAG: hypothetical protein ACJAQT_005267 [Akkermansiaceae bacterium]|jgi:hypothetical protein